MRNVARVFAGGVIGTALREGIVLAAPTVTGIPWAVLSINLVGAFALGMLLGLLAGLRETPARRDMLLFVGTGMLGGFTTYSALAVDVVGLFDSSPALAVAYGIGSILGGLATAAAGLSLGSRIASRRGRSA